MDVIQYPKSHSGSKYAIVFVNYVTKWAEVFPAPDQSALTTAQLLVEHVISHHGVPAQLLSHRGAAFISKVNKELCELMAIQKVNTPLTTHKLMA